MKKVIVSASFVLFSFGLFAQASNDKLPQTAQDFIQQHFSSVSIEEVKENNNWQLWEDEKYEVRLSNGIQLDFDEVGNVIEIDSQNNVAIPENALPSKIIAYLEANHPDAEIIGWEDQDKEQEVELSDGTEIEFDAQGNFRKLD